MCSEEKAAFSAREDISWMHQDSLISLICVVETYAWSVYCEIFKSNLACLVNITLSSTFRVSFCPNPAKPIIKIEIFLKKSLNQCLPNWPVKSSFRQHIVSLRGILTSIDKKDVCNNEAKPETVGRLLPQCLLALVWQQLLSWNPELPN